MDSKEYLEKYYYEKDIEEEFLKLLYKILKREKEIVVICIGNPLLDGNILAPLVGTFLCEQNIYNVYGTIKNPVDKNNIKEIYSHILNNYNNPYIISVGIMFPLDFHDEREVIILKNEPYEILSTSGNLKIGDASFKVVFDIEDNYYNVNSLEKLGLGKIYKYSKIIFKVLYYVLHNQNYVNKNKK
ncbi:DUF1256 domain-containing protein [Clostridium felsineum]|uniref:DUF1256 domain-containing protein n=1 Tax=Clostridium felsineum TaxID=36839 RepID=UPI00098CB886|nr:DUF1256 domain-containing protein [Clostridium felsineum]URZ00650.1 hypothetical protein CLAUR_006380 [Clostridium felsineum]URZ16304.1 hypothetical protein CLFE_023510 [Clostridium felsineum DSM 794]